MTLTLLLLLLLLALPSWWSIIVVCTCNTVRDALSLLPQSDYARMKPPSSALAATWLEAHAHEIPMYAVSTVRYNTSSCPALIRPPLPPYLRGGNEGDSIWPTMTKTNKKDVQCVIVVNSPFFSSLASLSSFPVFSFSPIGNQAPAHPVCWETLFSFLSFFLFFAFVFSLLHLLLNTLARGNSTHSLFLLGPDSLSLLLSSSLS